MSRNTSLGADLEAFIDQHVRSGQYASASEVVRAALRALEAEELRTHALLLAIDEGRAFGCGPAQDALVLEQDEPSPRDLSQASWWLVRVIKGAEEVAYAEADGGVCATMLLGRANACARVATWLEMRSRRRLLLLRLQAEEAKLGPPAG